MNALPRVLIIFNCTRDFSWTKMFRILQDPGNIAIPPMSIDWNNF